MSVDFDSSIQQKQVELDAVKARLEELRLQFVKDTIIFVAGWYETTSKQYATTNSQITLNLGKERLTEMKKKVNELVKDSGRIVSEILSEPSIWWDLTPHDSGEILSPYEQYGNRFPDILDKPVRRALGRLGAVLEEFGYGVKTRLAYPGTPEPAWAEYPTGPAYSKPVASPYYPHFVVWSEAMQNTIKQYNELYKQGIRLFHEIASLQDQKKAKQANDLWDSS